MSSGSEVVDVLELDSAEGELIEHGVQFGDGGADGDALQMGPGEDRGREEKLSGGRVISESGRRDDCYEDFVVARDLDEVDVLPGELRGDRGELLVSRDDHYE